MEVNKLTEEMANELNNGGGRGKSGIPDMDPKLIPPPPTNQREPTALEQWNKTLELLVSRLMRIHMTRNGMITLKKYEALVAHLQAGLAEFEVTKHRIIVDKMIAALQAAVKLAQDQHLAYSVTPWFFFRKKKRLRTEWMAAMRHEYTYRHAVNILTTTSPKEWLEQRQSQRNQPNQPNA